MDLLGHFANRTDDERTTSSHGLEPNVQLTAGERGMRIAATDETGEVRAIERVDHPFFVGTLFQPQLSSSAGKPHPVELLVAAKSVHQS